MSEKAPFDAPAHMRKIRTRQGMQDYLDVKWRLAWLRQEHPDAQIVTEQIEGDETHARFKCTIRIAAMRREEIVGNGVSTPVWVATDGAIATGHGSETQQDFPDFYEKAETKAIGRACAVLGYGTDAATDLDDGEPLDGAAAGKGERATRRDEDAPAEASPPPRGNVSEINAQAWLNVVMGEGKRTGVPISADDNSLKMAAKINGAGGHAEWEPAATGDQKRAAILAALKAMPDATSAPVRGGKGVEAGTPAPFPPTPHAGTGGGVQADLINEHQREQLTALVVAGFNLAARLTDMGDIDMDELTREQAKELIIEGRQITRSGATA